MGVYGIEIETEEGAARIVMEVKSKVIVLKGYIEDTYPYTRVIPLSQIEYVEVTKFDDEEQMIELGGVKLGGEPQIRVGDADLFIKEMTQVLEEFYS